MFMEKKRAFQMRKETEESMTEQSIPPNLYLGHVHLKVANLERALTFYLEVMGFELVCTIGTMAFVSAGGYHHRIGLNTWESKDGSPPTRGDLAVAYQRILDHGWFIDGSADHTSHQALYLHDPDENGIELAWDRDPSYWMSWYGITVADINKLNSPIDFDDLLAEIEKPS